MTVYPTAKPAYAHSLIQAVTAKLSEIFSTGRWSSPPPHWQRICFTLDLLIASAFQRLRPSACAHSPTPDWAHNIEPFSLKIQRTYRNLLRLSIRGHPSFRERGYLRAEFSLIPTKAIYIKFATFVGPRFSHYTRLTYVFSCCRFQKHSFLNCCAYF